MMTRRVLLSSLLAVTVLTSWLAAVPPQKEDAEVEHILAEMDKTASEFRSLQAEIRNTKFTKVVEDTSIETGRLWFRHERHGNRIKIEFKDPSRREILIADNKVVIYYPKIDKKDEYQLGSESLQNKAELGLLAGVGSSGETLRKTYSIRYLGQEKVDKKRTIKLVMTPRDPKTKSFFTTQEVWLDSENWIPVRQKLVEPSGDTMTIDFFHVEKNKRISDKVFRIKTK